MESDMIREVPQKDMILFTLMLDENFEIVSLNCICKMHLSQGHWTQEQNQSEHNPIKPLRKILVWDFPGGPVVKTPNAGGSGSIPGQGTRSPMLQLKIPRATLKKKRKDPTRGNEDPACQLRPGAVK